MLNLDKNANTTTSILAIFYMGFIISSVFWYEKTEIKIHPSRRMQKSLKLRLMKNINYPIKQKHPSNKDAGIFAALPTVLF